MTTIVLWAEKLADSADFYSALLSAIRLDESSDFVRINSAQNEVLLHAVPKEYREGVAVPPSISSDAVAKPVYQVASIALAREAVRNLGGQVYGAETENTNGSTRYCDGFDTEGNVFQLAEVELN